MYEVISTAVDTIENDELRELFLVAVSGLLLWLVLLVVEDLFVYCEETN